MPKNLKPKTNIMNPRKDWVTKAIMISSKTKEIYKIWEKDPNSNRKREEYKKFTKILKDIVNKAKESYDKLIDSSMNNIKSIWNVINQKIGKIVKRKIT